MTTNASVSRLVCWLCTAAIVVTTRTTDKPLVFREDDGLLESVVTNGNTDTGSTKDIVGYITDKIMPTADNRGSTGDKKGYTTQKIESTTDRIIFNADKKGYTTEKIGSITDKIGSTTDKIGSTTNETRSGIYINESMTDHSKTQPIANILEIQRTLSHIVINQTSNDTLTNYMATCRDDTMAHLLATCMHPEFSCRGRCGPPGPRATVTEDQDDADESISCSCDALCFIYGDCCMDFSEECHEEVIEYNRLHTALGNVGIVCKYDTLRVVSTCALGHPTQPVEDSLHSLNFIVSDSISGLQFANYSIYACNRLPGSTPLFWTTTIPQQMFDKSNFSMMASADFFDVLTKAMLEIPPENVTPRMCHHGVRVKCDTALTDACVFLDTPNANDMCQAVVTYMTSDADKARALDADKARAYSVTTDSSPGQSDNQTENICLLRVLRTVPKERFALGVLMTISEQNTVEFVRHNPPVGEWIRMDCTHDMLWGRENNCVVQTCANGSVFLNNGCYVAKRLRFSFHVQVSSLGQTQQFLRFLERNVVELNESVRVHYKGGKVSENAANEDEMLFSQDYLIASVSNEYRLRSENVRLPHVERMEYATSLLPEVDVKQFPRMLSVCMSLESRSSNRTDNSTRSLDWCAEVDLHEVAISVAGPGRTGPTGHIYPLMLVVGFMEVVSKI